MNQNGRTPGPPSATRPAGGDFTTAMVHLYRAEAAKAEAARRRLDTTTNWAVVTTAAGISFALGGDQAERHVVILLISFLVTFFLLIEARRYRYYDIWQTRVRLLETDYFAPLLWPEGVRYRPDWQQLLASDLLRPTYHISFAEAFGWRLRRNYVWLYATLLLTWCVKVAIHPTPLSSVQDIIARAALGPIPGWVMLLVGVLFNGALIVLAVATLGLHEASGEIISSRETHARLETAASETGAASPSANP